MGWTVAVAPRTSAMFAILDPIALPTASAALLCIAAVTETRISGAEVAIATTVRPMRRVGTPMFRAVPAAPTTNRSAPQISNAKPATVAAE